MGYKHVTRKEAQNVLHFNGVTTLSGVTKLFGRTRQTWYNACQAEKVDAAQIGNIWLISINSAQEYHNRTKDHIHNIGKFN